MARRKMLPGEEPRSVNVPTAFTMSEAEAIRAQAAKLDLTVSSFVRFCVLKNLSKEN